MTRKFKITNIEWDYDGENPQDLSLPTETTLTIDVSDEEKDLPADEMDDIITDALSDKYGFCFFSMSYTEIK